MRPLLISVMLFSMACTHPRVKRYQQFFDSKVGVAERAELDRSLGSPTSCRQDAGFEVCEYRTAQERNLRVPDVFRKEPAMGPDLSPYDHFDVLQLTYDNFGVLRDWSPILVK